MKQPQKIEHAERSAEARIRDEIAQLRRELEARKSMQRRAPSSVVRAYHALLERHYEQLDGLDRSEVH